MAKVLSKRSKQNAHNLDPKVQGDREDWKDEIDNDAPDSPRTPTEDGDEKHGPEDSDEDDEKEIENRFIMLTNQVTQLLERMDYLIKIVEKPTVVLMNEHKNPKLKYDRCRPGKE